MQEGKTTQLGHMSVVQPPGYTSKCSYTVYRPRCRRGHIKVEPRNVSRVQEIENATSESRMLSEPVPPTNSDVSGDKSEGLSTTSGGDAEVLRTLALAYVLRPCDTCILVFWRTKRWRSDEGRSCQKAEETEENRGEFTGSIQDDIQTEGQSPQHVEYLYFTSDMYSNQEEEERHSGDVAKSLQMTNR